MEELDKIAEEYARKVWGEYYYNPNQISEDESLGTLSEKDFKAGWMAAISFIAKKVNMPLDEKVGE